MSRAKQISTTQVLPAIRPIEAPVHKPAGNRVTRALAATWHWLSEVPEPSRDVVVAYQAGPDFMRF